jgi:hypothetical protein
MTHWLRDSSSSPSTDPENSTLSDSPASVERWSSKGLSSSPSCTYTSNAIDLEGFKDGKFTGRPISLILLKTLQPYRSQARLGISRGWMVPALAFSGCCLHLNCRACASCWLMPKT